MYHFGVELIFFGVALFGLKFVDPCFGINSYQIKSGLFAGVAIMMFTT